MPDRSHAGSRLEAEVGVMPRSPKERAAARGLRPPYRSELLVPYRRNFSNGVSRADGTASLDAPRSQVPAFPRQD
jgi:hypothetical protein